MTRSQTKIAFLLATAICFAFFIGCQGKASSSATGGQQVRENVVLGQGKILPSRGFSNLGAPGVVVSEVHVNVGDPVAKGDLLLTLQSRSALQSQIEGAEARIADIKQTRLNTISQAKMQMEIAELKKEQYAEQLKNLEPDQALAKELANQQLELAQEMLDKLVSIKADPLTREFVGLTEIEQQRSVVKDVELQIEQQNITNKNTKAQLKASSAAAEKEYDLAKTLLESAEKSQAMAVADAELNVLKRQLALTEVVSPFKGVVVAVNVSDGGIGTALPPIVLADTTTVYCEVEINEMDAGKVNINDVAEVTSPAFEEVMTGKVIRKSAVVGEPQLQTYDPLARIDYRAITVVVEFDPPFDEKVKNWLKLQVDVKIKSSKAQNKTSQPENTQT